MIREVKVRGLDELERKLGSKVLYEPEIDHALDTLADRVLRKRKTIGFQRNTLSVQTAPLSRSISTTLRDPSSKIEAAPSFGSGDNRRPNPRFNPRVTGSSLKRAAVGAEGYARGFLGAMLPNVIKKAIGRIEARWAA